jgi:hypothetical protein
MRDDVPAQGERDYIAASRRAGGLDADEIARYERGDHAGALNAQTGAAVVGYRPLVDAP